MVYEDWERRGTITITSPSSTAGFQAKITVAWADGMNADFSDIRFTTTAGVDIPYWLESYTASTSAIFWLKLPASTSSIYMYYGNTEATTASNGANTFELFDDFSAALDGSKWTSGYMIYENNGPWAITNTGYNSPVTDGAGHLSLGGTRSSTNTASEDGVSGTGFWGRSVRSAASISLSDFIIEASINFTQTSTGTYANTFNSACLGVGADKDNYIYGMLGNSGQINFQREIAGAIAEMASTQATYTAGTYRRYKFIFHDGTYCYYDVAGTSGSREMWQNITNKYILIGFEHRAPSASVTQLIDFVFVRKYAATEPSLSVTQTGFNPNYSGGVRTGTTTASAAAVTLKGFLSAAAGTIATPGYSDRVIIGGNVDTQATAAAETHDTKIQISTGITAQAQTAPRKDYISITQGLQTAPDYHFLDHLRADLVTATAPAVLSTTKIETLAGMAVGAVEVSKNINDAFWQLTTEFTGDNPPPEFFRVHHEALDYTGTSQHLFTGIIPNSEITVGSAGNKTKFTAYDFGWYLSAQYIPDDARTMEISTARYHWHDYYDWEDWINYLLQGTGITPYRIASGPSVDWKQFVFSNKTTKREAIDQISKFCNYIFEVKWRNYGNADDPDWRPVAYWVDQNNIDSSTAGLDIPAPITLTWPDQYLADLPKITTNPEEKINRVRIIGTDSDGDIYTAMRQTSAAAAGTDLAREYLEESSTLTNQTAVNNYANAMLTYFNRPAVSVSMRFIKRLDLQLYQKIKFGSGFPANLYALTDGRDGINYLRITGIKYHTEPGNNYCDVTAVYDHPIIIIQKRHRYYRPNWNREVEDHVRKGIEQQARAMSGTVESIDDDGKTAVLVTEFGSRVIVRIR